MTGMNTSCWQAFHSGADPDFYRVNPNLSSDQSTSAEASDQERLAFQSIRIGELMSHDYQVSAFTTVKEIAEIFKHHDDLPGAILISHAQFCGMISRKRCFEALGQPFGVEIYSRQTALDFYHQCQLTPLILDECVPIDEAVKIALGRSPEETYDPIVVRNRNGRYALVNMHMLLTAQCDLLEKLYARVRKSAVQDPLTHVLNRRGFFELAQAEWALAYRHSLDLSVMMVDIDYFKMVNDVYGHAVGDLIIRTVAEETQKTLRQTDIFARLGGEEFVILLSNTGKNAASMIAERIRAHIENTCVSVNGFQISVTLSVGVCDMQDARGSLDNLLTMADQAMYAAKWAGRNRVIQWEPALGHKVRQQINASNNGWQFCESADTARIYDETIEGWAKALDLRDKETEVHAQRVSSMTMKLARRLGMNEKQLLDVRRGALLHDIGKIAIPDSILFKEGPLTEAEWETMHKHPIYAFDLLSPISFLQAAIDIPYCHHEHWDGSGYPRGLKGEEIPLAARIFTIIDVWDALSTARCYRPAWQPKQVYQYLLGEAGRLLDPEIVQVFLKLLQEDESTDCNHV